jgi:hypothetical protein
VVKVTHSSCGGDFVVVDEPSVIELFRKRLCAPLWFPGPVSARANMLDHLLDDVSALWDGKRQTSPALVDALHSDRRQGWLSAW